MSQSDVEEADMINDYYYTATYKQHAQELREVAAQNRLADEALRVRRHQRAVERENRLLERAVQGRVGRMSGVERWRRLADLFRIRRLTEPGRNGRSTRQDTPDEPAQPVGSGRSEASADRC